MRVQDVMTKDVQTDWDAGGRWNSSAAAATGQ